jgi:hypothetical protein
MNQINNKPATGIILLVDELGGCIKCHHGPYFTDSKFRYLKLIAFLLLFQTHAMGKILPRKCKNVEIVPNFWYNPMKVSDNKLLAFNEKQEVHFASGELDFQRVNKWDDLDCLVSVSFENAILDSHMLYFQKSETKNRIKLIAEVEFDHPIVGFIGDGYLFAETNRYFAPNPTHTRAAEKPNVWSLEEESSWTPLDKVILLSPTRIRIEFTNQSATDPLRVITLRTK